MRDIRINNYGMRLTTDHPASSYGIPVLVDEQGQAYGPADNILGDIVTTIFGPTTGADIVTGAMPTSKTEANRDIWEPMERYLARE